MDYFFIIEVGYYEERRVIGLLAHEKPKHDFDKLYKDYVKVFLPDADRDEGQPSPRWPTPLHRRFSWRSWASRHGIDPTNAYWDDAEDAFIIWLCEERGFRQHLYEYVSIS